MLIRVLIILLLAAPALAAQNDYLPKGIYSNIPVDTAMDAATLTNLNISGVLLQANWDLVEATEGTYDWTYFTDEIARLSAGVKVVLSIRKGLQDDGLPSWYVGRTFTCTNDDPDTVGPIPYDGYYQRKWTTLYQSLIFCLV